jgi:hypothetical protein
MMITITTTFYRSICWVIPYVAKSWKENEFIISFNLYINLKGSHYLHFMNGKLGLREVRQFTQDHREPGSNLGNLTSGGGVIL